MHSIQALLQIKFQLKLFTFYKLKIVCIIHIPLPSALPLAF